MKRANETVAYYVVYATRSLTGVEKFKDAMWKVDPSTGSTFSDRNWNQPALFTGPNVDLSLLRLRLSEEHADEDVAIDRLEEYTLLETPFRRAHLRQALEPMEKRGEIHVTRPAGSRRGFPKGTQVRFNRGFGI